MKKLLLPIVFMLLAWGASARPRSETHLSNSIVNAIVEDNEGYIWIGTFRGLNRLNGSEYFHYYSEYDTLSIKNNQVKSLLTDTRGRLWVATVAGPSIYNPQEDNFHMVKVESKNPNLTKLLTTPNGIIIASDNMQVLKYDEDDAAFRIALSGDDLGWQGITCLISPLGDLWVCSNSFLRCYNPDTMALKYEEPLSLRTWTFFNMLGEHICISNEEFHLFSTVTRRYEELPDTGRKITGTRFSAVHPYGKDGVLLYSDRDGLYYYQGGKLLHQKDKGFPFTAPEFNISTMFTDSRGNLWLCSSDQGVQVIYNYKKVFNATPMATSGIQGKSISAVKEDADGNLWIATGKRGLYVYDVTKEELKPIWKSDISSIAIGDNGVVWLGSTEYSKIFKCRYERSNLTVEQSYDAAWPMSIAIAGNGDLWISSAIGEVMRIRQSDGVMESLRIANEFDFIPSVLPLPDGTVMVAGFNFPIRVITPTGASPQYWKVEDFKPFIDNYNDCIKHMAFVPTCLFRDSEGDIWLGTVANGVLRYSAASGKMEHITSQPCVDVESIEEDLEGNIWFSTQRGIGKWTRRDGSVLSFFKEYGMGGEQFCDRSSCMGSGGILYFGGTHGLTYFNPLEIKDQDVGNLMLESIVVDNGYAIPLRMRKLVELSHNQTTFNISFAAIDFSESHRVRYQYRLYPYESEWVNSEDANVAYYSNLSSGRYTFTARAISLDGTKVLAENSLDLRIKVAPWLRWWAIMLYLLIAASVATVIIIQARRLAEEKRRSEEVEKEREFFANVSHEFRTPLTMIAGPVKLLSDEKTGTAEAGRLLSIVSRNVDRMLRLVNQMLDYGKMEKDSLKLRVAKTDIIQLLSGIAETFSPSAAEKDITYSVLGLEGSMTAWVDEDKVEKVCYNMLSNAFKYTPSGGSVKFIFDKVEDGIVTIRICDSGPGVPEQFRERIFERYFQLDGGSGRKSYGTGIGLAYSRSLAQMHHGTLAYTGGGEPGAEFTFTLPVDESAYSASEKCAAPSGKGVFVKGELKQLEQQSQEETLKKGTILVVDDDIDVSHYVKEILSMSYNVICRFDAQSALSCLHETPADLIICDVMMPGRSGFELCRDIKSDLQLSHIPVVLVTAKTSVADQVEGLQSGADAYITKPFDPNYLLALVQSRLRNTEHLRSVITSATDTGNIEGEEGFTDRDKVFLDELYTIMEEGLSNSEIDINTIINRMKISRSKLYYKIKGLTGENPGELFRHYKLNRAAQLIREQKHNMSEIADMTGFGSLSHFSTSFKKQFGVPPSEYGKDN